MGKAFGIAVTVGLIYLGGIKVAVLIGGFAVFPVIFGLIRKIL
jgi:hypothetical protein